MINDDYTCHSSHTFLGVCIGEHFSYSIHVNTFLKLRAQSLYSLRLLRNQGLSRFSHSIVFQAFVVSRLVYCRPDMFTPTVAKGLQSLLKTHHKAVIVEWKSLKSDLIDEDC